MNRNSKSNINIKKITGNVVISHAQQGGITSHEHFVNKTPSKDNSFFTNKWVLSIGLIAAIFGILSYFGLQPQSKESKKLTPNINMYPSAKEVKFFKDTPINRSPSLKKKAMLKNEKKVDSKSAISVDNVKGDVVISQNQTGGITAHTVNITSEKYQELTNEEKLIVLNRLRDLINQYPVHPRIMIQVESGDYMRNKIASEFESILTQYDAGFFPKGNTFMGVFPDYPVTIISNTINKKYVDGFLKSISSYITSDFHFEYSDSFSKDWIKFYINGKPTFDQSGRVTIN